MFLFRAAFAFSSSSRAFARIFSSNSVAPFELIADTRDEREERRTTQTAAAERNLPKAIGSQEQWG